MQIKILTSLALLLLCLPSFADTQQKVFLSGEDAAKTTLWDFQVSGGRQAGKWKKIAVPACWEQQGFGGYTYGRYYKKGVEPTTETGHYRTSFVAPNAWADKCVEIVFEGVMTDAQVSINGKSAGAEHQGGFTAFRYDITDKLVFGKKNTLDVIVSKQGRDESIIAAERRADWWLFGGIYRPVYLRVMPKAHIDRVAVDARQDGTLNAEVFTENTDGKNLKTVVEVNGKTYNIGDRIPNIKPWDTEHPNLYTAKFRLVTPDGKIVDELSQRIGFRTIEFRYRDGFYLNGTKLLVKGVNRHCFFPETGRASAKAWALEDVKLIKGMNANAIRSHYPPDSHLLDICDSLGVLYFDELPGWQNCYNTEPGKRILTEMIQHDVNHPCIFVWSNGNEGGFNYDLDPMFSQLDPQKRHVVHTWALYDGVDAHHYPSYQTGAGRLQNGYQVFMPTEFLHGQYDKGAGASLDDFWSLWTKNPCFAGAFIWAFKDEGVVRTDRPGVWKVPGTKLTGEIDTDGPEAPDGIVGPHGEKEGSWFTIRDVWCPVQISPMSITKYWDGRFFVKNNYMFSRLDERCMMDYAVVSLSAQNCDSPRKVLKTGTIQMPHNAPGETSATTAVNIDKDVMNTGDVLELTALSLDGDTINTWSYPLCHPDEYFASHKEEIAGDATKDLDLEAFKNSIHLEPVGMTWAAVDTVMWSKQGNMICMEARFLKKKISGAYDNEVRNLGFTISFPENKVKGVTWMGKGPYRVWRNRLRGQNIGLWHKDYNNTITGESTGRLIYPEFKGYHANMYWAKIESDEQPLNIYTETDGIYLRLFTPEEPKNRRRGEDTMKPFPTGDISFLIEIPGIRSYKPIEQLGPDAQPSNIRINVGDEGLTMKLWFSATE